METAASSTTYQDRQDRRRIPPSGSQFGNATQSAVMGTAPSEPDFDAIHNSPEFVALRRRLWGFIFPVGAISLAWYFAYVVLSDYAPAFMSQKVVGAVNMGLALGLLQFVSTAALTLLYVRYARKQLDPRVATIREQANQR